MPKTMFTGANSVWTANQWKRAEFNTNHAACAKINAAMKLEEHQGWSNSATCFFNLYLLQEHKNVLALESMIRPDGTLDTETVCRWFRKISNLHLNPLVVDRWTQGPVSVTEIIENFLDDNATAKQKRKEYAAK